MNTLFDHTDIDGNRIAIAELIKDFRGYDIVVDSIDQYGAGVGVYANRAALVAALGDVTEHEFADMSTLAKKNLARYETTLAERDRARDLVARLEAENDRLEAANKRLLERDRRQREEIHRWRTEAENRRCIGHTAPAPDLCADPFTQNPGATWISHTMRPGQSTPDDDAPSTPDTERRSGIVTVTFDDGRTINHLSDDILVIMDHGQRVKANPYGHQEIVDAKAFILAAGDVAVSTDGVQYFINAK